MPRTMMLSVTGGALLGASLAMPRHGGVHCHNHEEVRQDAIWVVDCNGQGVSVVDRMDQGEFQYEAAGAEWSSRDARMSTVAVDLPHGTTCNSENLKRMARCIAVPSQYAWCGTESTARFVGDTGFPSYMETARDLRDATNICAPTNSTVRLLEPMRAYNEEAVYKAREAMERVDTVTLACMIAVLVCCWICNALAKGGCNRARRKERYSRAGTVGQV